MFCIINDKIYGGNKGSFDPFWRFIAQNGCKLRNDSLLPFSYISAGFIERDTHISYCLLYVYILLQCLLGHFTPKMCSINGFQLSSYQNCEPISCDRKISKKYNQLHILIKKWNLVLRILCVLLYSWIAVYSRNPNLKFKNWFRHIVALSLGCRNKHWSQFFYFIYRPCIVVQAGQKLKKSLNFYGRNKFKFVKAVLDEIRLKHCDHQFFLILYPMQSVSLLYSLQFLNFGFGFLERRIVCLIASVL